MGWVVLRREGIFYGLYQRGRLTREVYFWIFRWRRMEAEEMIMFFFEGFPIPISESLASRTWLASEYYAQCSRTWADVSSSEHLRQSGLSTTDTFERKAHVNTLLHRRRRRSLAFFCCCCFVCFRPLVRHGWCAAKVVGVGLLTSRLMARPSPLNFIGLGIERGKLWASLAN